MSLTRVLLGWSQPQHLPVASLTVLFPKARLLRGNEEEEEAEEDGDCGVGAVAFPAKETSKLEGTVWRPRAALCLRTGCLSCL